MTENEFKNPEHWPLDSKDFRVDDAFMGKFKLSDGLIDKYQSPVDMDIDEYTEGQIINVSGGSLQSQDYQPFKRVGAFFYARQ